MSTINKNLLTVEYPLVIWNDKEGSRIEVGPDRDGCNLVEIRSYVADSASAVQSVTMTEDEWLLVRSYVHKDSSKVR